MFRFHDPQYFMYAVLIPLALALFLFSVVRKEKVFKKIIAPRLYDILSSTLSKTKRNLKLLLQLLTVALLLCSLARPQMGQKSEKVKIEGIELVFAIDVSNSMMSEDVKPSRLELAKKSISHLLDRLPGHKVGLIAFAGAAALISPLTSDYSAIRMYIESLSTDSVSTQGTNFRETIITAANAFKRGGEDSDSGHKITRAVVIISDGEDNEKGALDKAKELSTQGIRIFTLGVGTERGGAIPVRDKFGVLSGYKKDKNNQPILSQVNSEFLEKLASVGKGGHYHATFTGEELSQLEEDINKLEKTEFESELVRNYDEKFQIPLLCALIFAMLELFLNEKRPALNLIQIYRMEMQRSK